MKKDSKGNQAKYVELNLFPEEIEDYQKDSISYFRWMVCVLPRMPVSTAIPLSRISTFS